ncbi:MAG: redoxin domain-containing protein [Gammaproteobacteria bacterium]
MMATTRSRAPEFPAGFVWFNVDSPVSLTEQLGRVVLLNFCAFSSVACRQLLADLDYIGNRYRRDLVILGIHSPRYPGEAGVVHLRQSINKYRVTYPMAHDAELKLWHAYGIKNRPTQVLIDRDGYIVGSLSGGGKRERLDQVIRYQCGKRSRIPPRVVRPSPARQAPATTGPLCFPGRLLVSGSKLFIADSGNNRILVVSRSGVVLRQYGSESEGLFDGKGESAAFNNPQGMVLVDDFLYVADSGNHAIRRINVRTDDVDTIAGNGRVGIAAPRVPVTPAACSLNSPLDLSMKDGALYIAMAGAHQIWRLSLVANRIEVFSGNGVAGLVDGPSGRAAFAQPSGLVIVGQQLFVVDADAGAIRTVDLVTGAVTTLVGSSLFGFGNRDGTGKAALLQYPQDITADPRRRMLWVADAYNNKIRRVGLDTRYISSPVVDRGLNEPGGLAFEDDSLYIANTNAHEILCINPDDGHATTLNVREETVEV